jgi:hypothetical protein
MIIAPARIGIQVNKVDRGKKVDRVNWVDRRKKVDRVNWVNK